jgi:hypothetical protein
MVNVRSLLCESQGSIHSPFKESDLGGMLLKVTSVSLPGDLVKAGKYGLGSKFAPEKYMSKHENDKNTKRLKESKQIRFPHHSSTVRPEFIPKVLRWNVGRHTSYFNSFVLFIPSRQQPK